MSAIEWVVSCHQHSQRKQLTYCYVQLNGEHIGIKACTCGELATATCAVDYHRHIYNQHHPMFPIALRRKPSQSAASKNERIQRETNR